MSAVYFHQILLIKIRQNTTFSSASRFIIIIIIIIHQYYYYYYYDNNRNPQSTFLSCSNTSLSHKKRKKKNNDKIQRFGDWKRDILTTHSANRGLSCAQKGAVLSVQKNVTIYSLFSSSFFFTREIYAELSRGPRGSLLYIQQKNCFERWRDGRKAEDGGKEEAMVFRNVFEKQEKAAMFS